MPNDAREEVLVTQRVRFVKPLPAQQEEAAQPDIPDPWLQKHTVKPAQPTQGEPRAKMLETDYGLGHIYYGVQLDDNIVAMGLSYNNARDIVNGINALFLITPEAAGDYSCATCGFGMKEPCGHWKGILARSEEPEAAATELPPLKVRQAELIRRLFARKYTGEHSGQLYSELQYAMDECMDLEEKYLSALQRLSQVEKERDAEAGRWQDAIYKVPVAVAKDLFTLGGASTGKGSYTAAKLEQIKNEAK